MTHGLQCVDNLSWCTFDLEEVMLVVKRPLEIEKKGQMSFPLFNLGHPHVIFKLNNYVYKDWTMLDFGELSARPTKLKPPIEECYMVQLLVLYHHYIQM